MDPTGRPWSSDKDASESYHQWKVALRTAHGPFDNERWLPELRDLTFVTELLPLPLPTAHAMIRAYKHRFNKGPAPSDADTAALREFEAQLHAVVVRVGSGRGGDDGDDGDSGAGCFVRLNSRSPKDAGGADRDTFAAELLRQRELMAAERGGGWSDGDRVDTFEVNARFCAYVLVRSCQRPRSLPTLTVFHDRCDLRLGMCALVCSRLAAAGVPGLRVTSGAQAMELMAKSERVFTDLLEATEAKEMYVGGPFRPLWCGTVFNAEPIRLCVAMRVPCVVTATT